ncbi:MAG: response regulator [Steroidobacteraceae bacterium]
MKNDPQDSDAITVLHVEDDSAILRATQLLLKSVGYRALVAPSAEAAFEQVRLVKPEVLIVDYQLGGVMTGTEVAEEIAQLCGYRVPTILLTADLANAEIPYIPGAPIMLAAKPIEPERLLRTVEHFAALHRELDREALTRSESGSGAMPVGRR